MGWARLSPDAGSAFYNGSLRNFPLVMSGYRSHCKVLDETTIGARHMSDFHYPYKDAEFILGELVEFDDLCEAGGLEDINVELASAVLEEATRLAAEVV